MQAKQQHEGGKAGLLSLLLHARGQLRPLPLLLSSLVRQAQRLLPVAAAAYVVTVLCALLQVVAVRKQDSLVQLLGKLPAL
jgi:hypothetical protein